MVDKEIKVSNTNPMTVRAILFIQTCFFTNQKYTLWECSLTGEDGFGNKRVLIG